MPRLSSPLPYLATVSLAFTACVGDAALELDETEPEIIGGKVEGGAAFDAIGAILIAGARSGEPSRLKTGTLIGPRLVLTSETSIAGVPADRLTFLIGKDALHPRRRVRVRAIAVETSVQGGAARLGIDAAVLHLEEAVTDVTPLPVAALRADQVGRRFRVFGFGAEKDGPIGTRRGGDVTLLGTRGNVFDLVFGSFEDFLEEGAGVIFPDLDPDVPADRKRLRGFYDNGKLLEGIDAWFGGKRGDANTCGADNGGPVTTKIGGKLTVVGIDSWTMSRAQCTFGTAASITSPALLDFIARERGR